MIASRARFLDRLLSTEPGYAVQFVVYLRLCALPLAAVGLLVTPVGGETALRPAIAWGAMLLVLSWSLAVLAAPRLRSLALAEIRELVLDLCWVALVVTFSGGTTNPFIYYYLVLVALGAILLPAGLAWTLCVASVLLYSAVQWLGHAAHAEHLPRTFRLHLIGMWVNYVFSTLLICLFSTRLITLLRRQQQQMLAVRESHLKAEQMIGLGTVAASAVHELATPLATLKLLLDEVPAGQQPAANAIGQADLALMREQIARCQRTIGSLATLSGNVGKTRPIAVARLVDRLRDHYALNNRSDQLAVVCDIAEHAAIQANDLLEYALINLINNALQTRGEAVAATAAGTATATATGAATLDGRVPVEETPVAVRFATRDDGLEIQIHNLTRATDAWLTRRWGRPGPSGKADGLGIGSFLANSTIESLGGRVSLEMSAGPEGSLQSAAVWDTDGNHCHSARAPAEDIRGQGPGTTGPASPGLRELRVTVSFPLSSNERN